MKTVKLNSYAKVNIGLKLLQKRIDGFHYYTSFIKYGLGRASMDSAQEIRNGLLTRDEGVSLVKKYV